MGIPKDAKSYTVTKFLNSGETPDFYQIFTMPFKSQEALNAAVASREMQEVAVDANRISTGGPIVILVEKE
jgi:uncharacterized protein (TIGR02118 family)